MVRRWAPAGTSDSIRARGPAFDDGSRMLVARIQHCEREAIRRASELTCFEGCERDCIPAWNWLYTRPTVAKGVGDEAKELIVQRGAVGLSCQTAR